MVFSNKALLFSYSEQSTFVCIVLGALGLTDKQAILTLDPTNPSLELVFLFYNLWLLGAALSIYLQTTIIVIFD